MSTNCIVASKMPSPPIALIIPTAKITSISPQTPATAAVTSAITHISRSSSTQQQCDTDSGKSSCSPALLDCSFDSGICLDVNDVKLHRQLQDFKRILLALERDREMYRLLRERLSKIVDRKNKKQKEEEEVFCNVCCAEIDPKNVKCFVQCSMCQKFICRDTKCADWIPSSAQWECQLCHASKESLALTSSWVAEQASFSQHKFIYPMRARSEVYIPISSDHNEGSLLFESVSQVGGAFPTAADAATTITAEQKLKIREYVEEVVAQMLGGSLENIAVGRLSQSESYLPALANGVLRSNSNNNNNNPAPSDNNGDLTDISHTRLRQLIESIIAETLRLQQPALSSSAAVSEVAIDAHSNGGATTTLPNGDARRHRTEHYFEPKIYQELLATAVLNKIADTHSNARHLTESGPDLLATADLNKNFKEHPGTLSSESSIEPQSDCSFTDTEQILNLSKGEDFSPCGSHANLNAEIMAGIQMDAGRESALSDYIAAHMVPLPDLSAPVTESEEDDYVSITSSQLGDGNWEDNWLFKKKKSSLKTPVTAGGVGMLVPAPREDVRAQIGDKIADEISDLSEVGSETDDSSLDLMRGGQMDPLNDRLLSKHLIGGQNTKLVLDELIDSASVISCTSPAENEPVYTETKNAHVVNTTTTNEAINTEVTKSVLTHSPPSTDTNTEPCEPLILPPPTTFDDDDINVDAVTNGTNCDNANPITATVNLIEALRATEGCTGFSTEVEVFDTDPNESSSQLYGDAAIPSVIEILAAIALGPMLAVPASEQQAVLTPIEMTSLKELSDLALAEIKARTPDPNYQILGVIPEENIEDTSLESTNDYSQAIETNQTKSEIPLDSKLVAAEIVPLQTKNDAVPSPTNSDCIITSAIETIVASTMASIVANSKNYEETVNSVAPVVVTIIDPILDAVIENNEPENRMLAESTEIVPSTAEALDISTLETPQVYLPPVIETVVEIIDINVPPHVSVPSAAEKNVSEIVLNTATECDVPPPVIVESTENIARPITETVDSPAVVSSVQENEPTLTVETELPIPVVAESHERNVVLAPETKVKFADAAKVSSIETPTIMTTVIPPPVVAKSSQNIAPLSAETLIVESQLSAVKESSETNAQLETETLVNAGDVTEVISNEPPPIIKTVIPLSVIEGSTRTIASLATETMDSPAKGAPVQTNASSLTVETDLLPPLVAETLGDNVALAPEILVNPADVTEVPSIETPASVEGSTQNIASLPIESIDSPIERASVQENVTTLTVETEVTPHVVVENLENNVVLIAETSVNPGDVKEVPSIETPAAVEETTQNIAPMSIEIKDIPEVSTLTVETELPPPVVAENLENNVELIAETSVNPGDVKEVPSIETPAAVEETTQNIAPMSIEIKDIPEVSTLTVETELPPPVVAENLENNVELIAETSVNLADVNEVPSIETAAVVEGTTQNITPMSIETIDIPDVSTLTVETELPPPVVAKSLENDVLLIAETSVNPGNVKEVPSIETAAVVEGTTQNIAPIAIETIDGPAERASVQENVSTLTVEPELPPPVVAENLENNIVLIAETSVAVVEETTQNIAPKSIETIDSPIEGASVQENMSTLTVETELPSPVAAENLENNVVLIAENSDNPDDVKEVPCIETPAVVEGTTQNVASMAIETIDIPAERASVQENVSTLTVETELPPPVVADNFENNVVLIAEASVNPANMTKVPSIETPASIEETTQNITPMSIEIKDIPEVSTLTVETELPPPVVAENLENNVVLIAETSVNLADINEVPSIEAAAEVEGTTENIAPMSIETIDISDVSTLTVETELPPPVVAENLENNVLLIAETSVNRGDVKEVPSIETAAVVEGTTQTIALIAIETIDGPAERASVQENVSTLTIETELPPPVVAENLENNVLLIAENSDNPADVKEVPCIETPAVVEGTTQNVASMAIETIDSPAERASVQENVSTLTVETELPPPVVADNFENNVVLIAEDSVNPANMTEVPSIETPAAIEETTQNIAPMSIEIKDIPEVSTLTVETELPPSVVVENLENNVVLIAETSVNPGDVKEVPSIETPAAIEETTQNIAPMSIEIKDIPEVSTLTVQTELPPSVVAENLENNVLLIAETSVNRGDVKEVPSIETAAVVEGTTQTIALIAIETIDSPAERASVQENVSTLTIETELPPPVVAENLENNIVLIAETSVAVVEETTQNIAPKSIETIDSPIEGASVQENMSTLTVETELPSPVAAENLENNVVLIAEASVNPANMTEVPSIETPASIEETTQNITPMSIEIKDIPEVSTLTVETELPPSVVVEHLENNVVLIAETSVNPGDVKEVPSIETPAAIEETTQNIAPMSIEIKDIPEVSTLTVQTELPPSVVAENLENNVLLIAENSDNPADVKDVPCIETPAVVEGTTQNVASMAIETIDSPAERASVQENVSTLTVEPELPPPVVAENLENNIVLIAETSVAVVEETTQNIAPKSIETIDSPIEGASVQENMSTLTVETELPSPVAAENLENNVVLIAEASVNPANMTEVPSIETPASIEETTQNITPMSIEIKDIPEVSTLTVETELPPSVVVEHLENNVLLIAETSVNPGDVKEVPSIETPAAIEETTQNIAPMSIEIKDIPEVSTLTVQTELPPSVVAENLENNVVLIAETSVNRGDVKEVPSMETAAVEGGTTKNIALMAIETLNSPVERASVQENVSTLTVETELPPPAVADNFENNVVLIAETSVNPADVKEVPSIEFPAAIEGSTQTITPLATEIMDCPAGRASMQENIQTLISETEPSLPIAAQNLENAAPPVNETVTNPSDSIDMLEIVPCSIVATVIPLPEICTNIASPQAEIVVYDAEVGRNLETIAPPIVKTVIPVNAETSGIIASTSVVETSDTLRFETVSTESIVPIATVQAAISVVMKEKSIENIASAVAPTVANLAEESEILHSPIIETIVPQLVKVENKESILPLAVENAVNSAQVAQVPVILPLSIVDTVIDSPVPADVVVKSSYCIKPPTNEAVGNIAAAIDMPEIVVALNVESVIDAPVMLESLAITAPPVDQAVGTDFVQAPINETLIPPENIPPIAETLDNISKATKAPEILPPPIIETSVPSSLAQESVENIVPPIGATVVISAEAAEFVPAHIGESIIPPPIELESTESIILSVAETIVNHSDSVNVQKFLPHRTVETVTFSSVVVESTVNKPPANETAATEIMAAPTVENITPHLVVAGIENIVQSVAETVDKSAVATDVPKITSPRIVETFIPPATIAEITENISLPVVETEVSAAKAAKTVLSPFKQDIISSPVIVGVMESIVLPTAETADNPANPQIFEGFDSLPVVQENIGNITVETVVVPAQVPAILSAVMPSICETICSLPDMTQSTEKILPHALGEAGGLPETLPSPILGTVTMEAMSTETFLPPLISEIDIHPPLVTESTINIALLAVETVARDVPEIPPSETINASLTAKTLNSPAEAVTVPDIVPPPIVETLIPPLVIADSTENIASLEAETVASSTEAADVPKIGITKTVVHSPSVVESKKNGTPIVVEIASNLSVASEITPISAIESINPQPIVMESTENIVLSASETIHNLAEATDFLEMVPSPIVEAVIRAPVIPEITQQIISYVTETLDNPAEALDAPEIVRPSTITIIPPPVVVESTNAALLSVETIINPSEAAKVSEKTIAQPILVEPVENIVFHAADTEILPPPRVEAIIPSPAVQESSENVELYEVRTAVNPADDAEIVTIPIVVPNIFSSATETVDNPAVVIDLLDIVPTLMINIVIPPPLVAGTGENISTVVAEAVISPGEAVETLTPTIIQAVNSPPVLVESTKYTMPLTAEDVNIHTEAADVPETSIGNILSPAVHEVVEILETVQLPIAEKVIPPPAEAESTENIVPPPIVETVNVLPVVAKNKETVLVVAAERSDEQAITAETVILLPVVDECIENISLPVPEAIENPAEAEEIMHSPTIEISIPSPIVVESLQNTIPPSPDITDNTAQAVYMPPPIVETGVAECTENVAALVTEAIANPAETAEMSENPNVETVVPLPMLVDNIEIIAQPEAKTITYPAAAEVNMPIPPLAAAIDDPSEQAHVAKIGPLPIVDTVINSDGLPKSATNIVLVVENDILQPEVAMSIRNITSPLSIAIDSLAEVAEVAPPTGGLENMVTPQKVKTMVENSIENVALSADKTTNNPAESVPEIVPNPVLEIVIPRNVSTESTENIPPPIAENIVNSTKTADLLEVGTPPTFENIFPSNKIAESRENILSKIVVHSADAISPPPVTETIISLPVIVESTAYTVPLGAKAEDISTKVANVPETMSLPITEAVIPPLLVTESTENIPPFPIVETSPQIVESTEIAMLPSIDETVIPSPLVPVTITETDIPLVLVAESTENIASPPVVETVTQSPVEVECTKITVVHPIVETIIPVVTKNPENIMLPEANPTQVVEIVQSAIAETIISSSLLVESTEEIVPPSFNTEAAGAPEIVSLDITATLVPAISLAENIENISPVDNAIPSPVVVLSTETAVPPLIVETVIPLATSTGNKGTQVVETVISPSEEPIILQPPIVDIVFPLAVGTEGSENTASMKTSAEDTDMFPPLIVQTFVSSPVGTEGAESIMSPTEVEAVPTRTVESVIPLPVIVEITENIAHPVITGSMENIASEVFETVVNPDGGPEVPPVAAECVENILSLPIVEAVILAPVVEESITYIAPLQDKTVNSTVDEAKIQGFTAPISHENISPLPVVEESTENIAPENATPALDETVGIADVPTASLEVISASVEPPSIAETANTSAETSSVSVQEISTLIVEVSDERIVTPTQAVIEVDIVPPTKIDNCIASVVVLSTDNVPSPVAVNMDIPAVLAELTELAPFSSAAETDAPEIVSHSNVEAVITPSAFTKSTDYDTAPAAKSEVSSTVEEEVAAQGIPPVTGAEKKISETLSPLLTEPGTTLALSMSTESCVTVAESEIIQTEVQEIAQDLADAEIVVAKKVAPIIDETSIVENPEIIATEVVTPETVPPSFTECAMSSPTAAEPDISAIESVIAEELPPIIVETTPSASTETVFPSETPDLSDPLLPQVIEHVAIAPPAIVSQETSAADAIIASTEETVIATPVIVPDTDLVEPVPPSVGEPKSQEIIVHSDNLESNTISDDLPPDRTHVVGNNTRRGLTRQCNVIDTTPSVDEAQPKGVSLLATICKCYIKDKRLLKSLENRRRQTILIQRYLNSFDSTESEEYPNDILLTEHTSIFTPETPYPIENDHEHEDYVVGELSELSFNFFNNVLFSDQLSSDSNNTEGSIATAVETFATDERSPAAQLCVAPAQCDEYEYGFNSSSIVLTPATNHHLTHNQTTNTTNTNNSTTTTTITNHKTNVQLTNGSIAGVHKSAACSEEPLLHDDEEQEHVDDDLVVMRRFVPGSIAEREYKKWYNAVDMPNNPYAPEALKRRISGSQERFIDLPNISPSTEQNPISLIQNASKDEIDQSEERDYKRYSRDYYINDMKQSPTSAANITNSMKSSSTTTLTGGSQESTPDITINEAQIANTNATAITTSPSQDEHIFQAIPAQVVEDPASLDTQSTLSNQSIQSATTTTSDDSDTIRIYDFKKQETTVIRDQSSNMTTTSAIPEPTTTTTLTQSTTVESNTMLDAPVVRKARPTQLAITSSVGSNSGDPAVTLGLAGVITSPFTPTRGSTPTAFKFLQPKRKLIEPCQVLSFDEEGVVPPPTPVERKTIEEDVAQALPSVKALAQAFLMTSHKRSQVEKRWHAKPKLKTSTTTTEENLVAMRPKPTLPLVPTKQHVEASPSYAEAAEDATIASDLSSLETDPPTQHETKDSKNAAGKTSPSPLRAGYLKSNIAFFENLKFK